MQVDLTALTNYYNEQSWCSDKLTTYGRLDSIFTMVVNVIINTIAKTSTSINTNENSIKSESNANEAALPINTYYIINNSYSNSYSSYLAAYACGHDECL